MTATGESLDALRDQLVAEEAELQFPSFTPHTAWLLGSHLVEAARRNGLPIAISIRKNSQDLFFAALEGAAQDNAEWIRRKCAVVDRYGHSSLLVGTTFRLAGREFDADSRLDVNAYAAHGGAFPLIVRGAGAVGTIAVSGLPQVADHEFVVGEIRRFLAQPASS